MREDLAGAPIGGDARLSQFGEPAEEFASDPGRWQQAGDPRIAVTDACDGRQDAVDVSAMPGAPAIGPFIPLRMAPRSSR